MAETPGKGRVRRKDRDANGAVPSVRYSRELGLRIARRLAAGETWSQMWGRPGMPSYGALYSWQPRHPEFAEAVRLARLAAAELRADRALEVAENAPEGVQGDRLRVATLMQRAALDAPAEWGGKAPATCRADDGPPRKVEVTFRIRDFDLVTLPDGTTEVQEVAPEGGAEDDIDRAMRLLG